MKNKIILLIIAINAAYCAVAYDFTGKTAEGRTMFFSINAKGVNTCEVTFDKGSDYSGIITIPGTVEYQGQTYKVTAIGKDAFRNCQNIIMVKIPNNVRTIKESAFENCQRMKLVELPPSIMQIQKRAFANCSGLTQVTFGNYLANIGELAFENCRFLAYITFNSQVKIAQKAFNGCDKIIYIYCNSNVPPVIEKVEQTFMMHIYRTTIVYAPEENIDDYKSAIGWKDFRFLKVEEEN